ncbi:MAG: NRDE family protein [Steroidobacteraceae bacterium]
MCLVVLAHRSHARYRTVIAANRDEFHDRAAAPLGWWSEGPRILAGRDLAAGGTWLGASPDGRFGVVTNYREFVRSVGPDAPSRGGLVPGFLAGSEPAAAHLERTRQEASRYAGYNLLLDDGRSLWFASNAGGGGHRELPPGVYGLANQSLDEPAYKVTTSRTRLEAALARDEIDPESLFELLADRAPPTDVGAGPLEPALASALAAPFVLHPRYGTRCSTVVLATRDGRVVVAERRYGADGRMSGASRHEFLCPGPGR